MPESQACDSKSSRFSLSTVVISSLITALLMLVSLGYANLKDEIARKANSETIEAKLGALQKSVDEIKVTLNEAFPRKK